PEPAPEHEGQKSVPADIVDLIADSLESITDEDGYAFMGELGNLLLKKQPDFDPRNFGFSKLTTLVKSLDRFEIDARQTSAPHVKHIYLRDKQRK
ncbi:MAG TPA: OST-HTH/LOTUS domain-containing protein, partial [Pseudoflavonifractor sp.]|nr:OST-HTH/LOTUS domain-containing protein [Pseudoflavonifractor sp.]